MRLVADRGWATISAVPVKTWLTEATLYRLDTPEVVATLEGRQETDAKHADAVASLEAAQRRLMDVAEMFAAGEITKAEYLAARPVAEAKAAEAARVLEALASKDTLGSLVGNGTILRETVGHIQPGSAARDHPSHPPRRNDRRRDPRTGTSTPSEFCRTGRLDRRRGEEHGLEGLRRGSAADTGEQSANRCVLRHQTRGRNQGASCTSECSQIPRNSGP